MGRQWEREYAVAYLQARYPRSRHIQGAPLGPVPQEMVARYGMRTALRMGRGLRPEADLLVWGEQELVLIECKIFKWLDGLSKLPTYKGLVATTPELEEWRSWPVRMVLATPWIMETMREAALVRGVELDEFETPEAHEYLAKLNSYWTSEAKVAREQRQRARALLGLE